MIRPAFILALSLAATGAGAATPARFDLACAIGPDGEPPTRATYHVDTLASRWCVDSCRSLHRLGVTPRTLTFTHRRRRTADGGTVREDLTVDRFTGRTAWLDAVTNADGTGHATQWEGTCKPGPYTGGAQRLF